MTDTIDLISNAVSDLKTYLEHSMTQKAALRKSYYKKLVKKLLLELFSNNKTISILYLKCISCVFDFRVSLKSCQFIIHNCFYFKDDRILY